MLRNRKRARSALAPRSAGLIALCAGFAGVAFAAETLAQPKDDALERVAANYIRYREDVAAIETTPFDSADVTRQAHRRLGAHDSDALSAGWVAYAALVAADTPAFADALKTEMAKKARRGKLGGRDALLSNLAQNPSYARSLPGADQAIEAVLAMTAQDGARITALGRAFKSQAYAMQKTRWGKQRIASSQDRLKEAASYQAGRGAPDAPVFAHSESGGVIAPALASADGEWAPDWGEQAPAGHMGEANAEVIMDRVLNLAARYSSGALNAKVVSVYARNDKSNRCLTMAKLTLDQCIAATRTPYEEAFCLGEHALIDVADCVGWVGDAGAS